MRGIERYYTLRRRRLAGLCALAVFLMVGYALNGWTVTPIWTLLQSNEGTFAAGDPYGDWIYAVCDGEQQQVTVSRSGRLEGAAALDSLRTVRFPNWCDLPIVDNPDLAEWQAQLSRLEALTGNPGSSGAEILNVAREMPVSYLYLKPISAWIHSDYSNAAAFLDAVAERPMHFDHFDRNIVRARRQAFSGLIEDALESAASRDVAPERLERWLAEEQIVAGSSTLLQRLASMPDLTPAAAAMILERLEAVPRTTRAELYATLAPRLVHEDRFAALLAEQLRLLPTPSRSVNARRLLMLPEASPQFAIALLAEFRRSLGHESPDAQLDVFMAIASKLRDEPAAPLLLTRHLRDLQGMQRRMAATYLLSLDESDESAFTLGVLRAFSDFHPLSRSKVVYAVMQSPQFHDRVVQEACLLAVRLQMQGPERQELLSAMLRHRELDEDLLSRIRAELG